MVYGHLRWPKDQKGQSLIHHIGHKCGQAFARWACTVCAVWSPRRNGRWAHWLLDIAVHLVLVLVVCMPVEVGGRKDYFLFVFTWTASFWKVMNNKLCLYVNGVWSSACCSFGNWFCELKLACLKKAYKIWKLGLRFQMTQRRSLS